MPAAVKPIPVNPDYVRVAAKLPLAERKMRMALVDTALARGAVQGPSSVWPDPNVKMDRVLTPDENHWVRRSLLLMPDERAALRAAIAKLPDEAESAPYFQGQGQGGRGRHNP